MAKSFKFSLLKLNAFRLCLPLTLFFSPLVLLRFRRARARCWSCIAVRLYCYVLLCLSFLGTKWKCLVESGRWQWLCSLFVSSSFDCPSVQPVLLAFRRVSMFSLRKLFKCVLTKDLLVLLKGVLLFAVFSHSLPADIGVRLNLSPQTVGANYNRTDYVSCLALL